MRMILLSSALTAGALFDLSPIYSQLASMFSAAALWAGKRARPDQEEELRRLTERLRNPSPMVRLRRKMDRRRAS